MHKLIPAKLQKGDVVRVIAPSRSLAIIEKEIQEVANKRFEEMGLRVTFGQHVQEKDEFDSSSIESRIEDLHDAFSNKQVKGIFSVIGGFNSNQLLRYIDWDLIRNNPKVFSGYSDITALNNAIFAKTGLVNYSGPSYSTFGQKLHFEYTLEYFRKCVLNDEPFDVTPSENWSDDLWYLEQDKRDLIKNPGILAINEGQAEGTVIGANLCTLNLLQGTEYMPSLKDSILFIEDDYESKLHHFDRDLQSLIHLPDFNGVKGIVIGRFQKESDARDELIIKMIKTKKELNHLPVIANANFGHTDPKFTLPIGATAKIAVKNNTAQIELIEH